MAQTPPPTPPDATPQEQALVPPQRGPEDLIYRMHREMGEVKAELLNLRKCSDEHAAEVKSLRSAQFWLKGALAVVTAAVVIVGFFISGKITTLLKMADERQVQDAAADRGSASAPIQPPDVNGPQKPVVNESGRRR